jgi:uncharacterized lipoprotein YbaY
MKKVFIFAAVAMLLASCSSTSTEAPTCTDTTAVDSVAMASETLNADENDTNIVVLDDVVYHLDSTAATVTAK